MYFGGTDSDKGISIGTDSLGFVYISGFYNSPDALEVVLDSFEGPLDLLLYLIKKVNLIYDKILNNSTLLGNEVDYLIEKGSMISINDAFIKGEIQNVEELMYGKKYGVKTDTMANF